MSAHKLSHPTRPEEKSHFIRALLWLFYPPATQKNLEVRTNYIGWESFSPREGFWPVLSASKKLIFSLHQYSCYIPLWIRTACVQPQQLSSADAEGYDHIHILHPHLSVNSWHPQLLPAPTISRTEHDTDTTSFLFIPVCLWACVLSTLVKDVCQLPDLPCQFQLLSLSWDPSDMSDDRRYREVMACCTCHDRAFH